jgi:hypothetical protein
VAGMQMQTGLTGSVVGRLYQGAASVPMAGIPEGGTISEAAYGSVPGVNTPGAPAGLHAMIVSGACLVILGIIWWGLPR